MVLFCNAFVLLYLLVPQSKAHSVCLKDRGLQDHGHHGKNMPKEKLKAFFFLKDKIEDLLITLRWVLGC